MVQESHEGPKMSQNISAINKIPEFAEPDEIEEYFKSLLYAAPRITRSLGNGAEDLSNRICFACGGSAYLDRNGMPNKTHKCPPQKK
jgi:hypothetical protein